MKRNIRFAGAGGQGVILSSVLLAKAYGLGRGYNISQTQSYGPEARGGACKAELIVSDREIDYMKVSLADCFIALSREGFDKYIGQTARGAIVLVNSTLIETDHPGSWNIPATEIADDLGSPKSVNMVMLGALAAVLGDLDYEVMKMVVEKNTGEAYRDVNLAAFEKGYARAVYVAQEGSDADSIGLMRRRVMVGVTSQRKCERLISSGKELLGGVGELSIIHISESKFSQLGNEHEGEGEILDYLYESAIQHETNLIIIRSGDVASTIENLVVKNKVDCFIIGESGESDPARNMNLILRERIGSRAELVVVPM